MRRRSFVLLLAICWLMPWHSLAGTVTRGTKASGGTDYVQGFTISPDEVNTDFNNIYNEFNGNIDNDNIKSGAAISCTKVASASCTDTQISTTAAIQPSKIDDHADSDANFRAIESPGRTGSLRKPTSLEGELERLRFGLKEAKLGLAITNDSLTWMDQAVRGSNHVFHGSFEATDGEGNDSSTTVPTGWALSNSPTIAYAATDVSEGAGLEVQVTASGGANESITQTLASLLASTSYLAIARVKHASGTGGCKLKTTGAAPNAGSSASASTTASSYTTVADRFTTDATPTSVVLTLQTNTDTEQCDWDHVGVYKLADDFVPEPNLMSFRITGDNDSSACQSTFGSDCTQMAALEVEPPGPGYIAQINAWGTFACTTAGQMAAIRIYESNGATELIEVTNGTPGNSAASSVTVRASYLYTAPLTPNTRYVFQVDGREGSGDACSTSSGVPAAVDDPHGIEVLLMRP